MVDGKELESLTFRTSIAQIDIWASSPDLKKAP